MDTGNGDLNFSAVFNVNDAVAGVDALLSKFESLGSAGESLAARVSSAFEDAYKSSFDSLSSFEEETQRALKSLDALDMAKVGIDISTPLGQLNGLSEVIKRNDDLVKELTNETAKLSRETSKAFKSGDTEKFKDLSEQMKSVAARLGDAKAEGQQLKAVLDSTRQSARGMREETDMISTGVGKLNKVMGAVFSIGAAKKFVTEIANVRGQFQQYEVAMETLLGSKELSDKVMGQAIDLAAKTPFYVSDVVGGAKQLLAYGESAETVVETLRRLGDIASGLSVPLNRVVAIYGKIQAQGKLTNLTMKQFYSTGIPIVSELAANLGKTEAEIQKMISSGSVTFQMVSDAFKTMTDEGGKFGNMMEKQSHTITGHINVIKGLVQNMMNDLGKGIERPIESVLTVVEKAVTDYEAYGKVLASLIGVYGTAKVAQWAYVAAIKAGTGAKAANTIALGRNTKEQYKNILALEGAKKANAALSKAILSNPYVLAATALAALTAGIIAYTRANNFGLQAQKDMNKALSGAAAESTKEQAELNKIYAKLSTAKKGTDDYNKSRQELISKFGKYHSGLETEIDTVDGLSTAYETLSERIREAANQRGYESFISQLQSREEKALGKAYDNILKSIESRYGKGSVKSYKAFFDITSALTSGKEIPEEYDELIKSFNLASWGIGNNSTGNPVFQQANTLMDNIKKVQAIIEDTKNLTEAGNEAFDTGAKKSELETAIENLSDADLSGLLEQINQVKETLSGAPAQKSELETAIENLSDADLSSILSQIREAETEIANAPTPTWSGSEADVIEGLTTKEITIPGYDHIIEYSKDLDGAVVSTEEDLERLVKAEQRYRRQSDWQDKRNAREEAARPKTIGIKGYEAGVTYSRDGNGKVVSSDDNVEAAVIKEWGSREKSRKERERKEAEERAREAETRAEEAAKGIKAQRAFAKQEESAEKERSNLLNNAQNERIALMEDGTAKEIAEAEARLKQFKGYTDEEGNVIDGTIEHQKKAYIDRLKEVERARWKAQNPDTKAEWDESTFKLTPEQEAFIEQMFGENGVMVQNAEASAQKAIRKSINAQLSAYGNYWQKRDALAKQYTDKIAEEEKRLETITDKSQQAGLQAIIDQMKKQREVELAQADLDYVSEYGGATQKREATERLWQAKIEVTPEGLKAGVEKQMREALAALDLEQFKTLINWDVVFGNMSESSTEAIVQNMAKVRAYLSKNRDSLGVNEVRDLEEALSSMSDELASRNPLLAIKTSVAELKETRGLLPSLAGEYREALVVLKQAEADYTQRKAELTEQHANGAITEGQYTEALTVAQGRLDEAQDRAAQSGTALRDAQNSITVSSTRLLSGINGIRSSVQGLAGDAQELASVMSDADDDVQKVVSDAISLFTELGDIGLQIAEDLSKTGKETEKTTENVTDTGEDLIEDVQDVGEGTAEAVGKASEATAEATSAAENASVALLVIKGVLKILTAIYSIMNDNEEAAQRASESARKYAIALEEVSDAKRLDNLSSAFGEDEYRQFLAYAEQLKSASKSISEARDLFTESEVAWRGIPELAGKVISADMRSGWQKFWDSGKDNIRSWHLDEFYEDGELDVDKLKAMYDEYGDYMDDRTKALLETLISEGERGVEAAEGMTDYLESLFGDVASNVAGAMVDAFTESGDALADLSEYADDFKNALAKSIATSMLLENVFTPEAQEKMKQMLLAGDAAGAANYMNKLLDDANEYAPGLTEFFKGIGLGIESTREAVSTGAAQASQDSIDEFNGRITVIQGHTYEINENVRAMRDANALLSGKMNDMLFLVRDIQASNRAILDRTAHINNSLDEMKTKGVRVNMS